MTVISVVDAATHTSTDLINALKNSALAAPFEPLDTEKLDELSIPNPQKILKATPGTPTPLHHIIF